MNLQSFWASPTEITFVRLLKSSMSYFPLVLCVISYLKCILFLHKSVGKLNSWMQISFIILFMIDLYRDSHVRECVCVHVCVHLLTFSLKNFSETIDWTFTKFHSSVP